MGNLKKWIKMKGHGLRILLDKARFGFYEITEHGGDLSRFLEPHFISGSLII
jgi:hypothetical protein